ncbi:MAG: peptide MFS transporter, partial [Hyphomicrobium sp.]
ILAVIWVTLGVRQPSAAVKFALGLLFVGLSFALMIPAATLAMAGKVSPLWLVGLFFLQTVGELMLSPVGLSTMTKLAPPRLSGQVLGLWFLAVAFGNKLAGVLGGAFDSRDAAGLADHFATQAMWIVLAAGVLFALAPWVRKLSGDSR